MMFAETFRTAEIVYEIPLSYSVVVLAVVALVVGTIVGAWWTSNATADEIEDRARRIATARIVELEERVAEVVGEVESFEGDGDLMRVIALLLRRAGGTVELTDVELVEIDRDPPTIRRLFHLDRPGMTLTIDDPKGPT